MGLIVSCVGEEKEQASPTIEEEEEEEEEDAGGDVFDSNETCEQIVRAKFQFAGENEDEVWKLTVCLAYHNCVLFTLLSSICTV